MLLIIEIELKFSLFLTIDTLFSNTDSILCCYWLDDGTNDGLEFSTI